MPKPQKPEEATQGRALDTVDWQALEQELTKQSQEAIRQKGGYPYLKPKEGENRLELITTKKPEKDKNSTTGKYLVFVKNLDDNQEYQFSVSPATLRKIVQVYNQTKNPKFILIRVGIGQQTRYSVKPYPFSQ
ncbi:hypothetical protein B9Q01_10570 [Candidatus Marsarchaeota G1 archaeon OSP_D]|jgi:hypothetical protein|uniref:Uncharacterized protein n=1 Tax=Candidatus Marsarchaeota G1 archaeon OSP_D TaxID=1978155 RepID=A0A2R6A5R2_9ARCH|nr:MAG: hypothetical protein B9Q01_10570 [Candidatus Marsarchaeota G1 archaeon OSP_D]